MIFINLKKFNNPLMDFINLCNKDGGNKMVLNLQSFGYLNAMA